MGHSLHSEDDAVHKIPHKIQTHWQNKLKFSVLVWFTILYRTRYKKIDVRLVQCPFNQITIMSFFCFNNSTSNQHWTSPIGSIYGKIARQTHFPHISAMQWWHHVFFGGGGHWGDKCWFFAIFKILTGVKWL